MRVNARGAILSLLCDVRAIAQRFMAVTAPCVMARHDLMTTPLVLPSTHSFIHSHPAT